MTRTRRAWRARLGHGRTGLTLTSMMDILTVLLLFVLKSYAAGGEVTLPPPGVQLPRSSADAAMARSLVVSIDGQHILLGGERVATVDAALAGDTPLIAPLAERLRDAHARMDALADRRGDRDTETHVVTIQGDRGIEFRILQRVMYTVNASGFDDIALAVLKRS
jgi:biopolymer transport protein ExbD